MRRSESKHEHGFTDSVFTSGYLSLTSTRLKTAFERLNIKSEADLKKAFKEKKLVPGKTRGYGKKTHREFLGHIIRAWALDELQAARPPLISRIF
jgi:hypothetical protein